MVKLRSPFPWPGGQQSESLALGSLPQTLIETNEFERLIAGGKAVKCGGQLEGVA